VAGAIYGFQGDDLEVEAAWSEGRAIASLRARRPFAGFERQPDGRWKGGGSTFDQTVVLAVDGPRLTGPSVDVTLTRVKGGFRLDGLLDGKNVDLLVDAAGARAHGRRYARDAQGALVSEEVAGVKVVLYGEAARLEDPPWPEFAIAALSLGWGAQGVCSHTLCNQQPAPGPAAGRVPRGTHPGRPARGHRLAAWRPSEPRGTRPCQIGAAHSSRGARPPRLRPPGPRRTPAAPPTHGRDMGRIVTIANQKGGVGKTTTAVNLAASLAAAERRTLLVDLDPQGNAGSALGVARDEVEASIYDVLLDGRPIREVVRRTELKFLDLVPASRHLVGAELELAGVERREYRLRDALEPVARDYEHVLVDCPPSLGLLTLNGLVAAHGVVVPLQCEYFALEGLADILRTVELVRAGPNPRLEVDGILLTMFAPNNLASQVADDIRKHFSGRVFETVIPRNVRLAESQSHGRPVLLYDVASKGSQSYLAFAKELARRGARRERRAGA
jgi:chromosome partitioning protein